MIVCAYEFFTLAREKEKREHNFPLLLNFIQSFQTTAKIHLMLVQHIDFEKLHHKCSIERQNLISLHSLLPLYCVYLYSSHSLKT